MNNRIGNKSETRVIPHKVPTPYPVGPITIYEVYHRDLHLLIDTGPPTDEARRFVQKNVDIKSLDYLLVTHFHPDHYGLLSMFESYKNLEIYISKYDAAIYQRVDERISFFNDLLRGISMPQQMIDQMMDTLLMFKKTIPFIDRYKELETDEELLQEKGISFVSCPGHSQSDIVFLISDYAITGDVMLREIFQSPLLDMDFRTGEGRFSNYQAYCKSLSTFKSLEDRNICPAHNDYIRSVSRQITFYVTKMMDRIRLLASDFNKNGLSWSLIERTFPGIERKPFALYVKVSELFFLYDFIASPQILIDALSDCGFNDLSDGLQEFVREIAI